MRRMGIVRQRTEQRGNAKARIGLTKKRKATARRDVEEQRKRYVQRRNAMEGKSGDKSCNATEKSRLALKSDGIASKRNVRRRN